MIAVEILFTVISSVYVEVYKFMTMVVPSVNPDLWVLPTESRASMEGKMMSVIFISLISLEKLDMIDIA
jgi:hypothetical protein